VPYTTLFRSARALRGGDRVEGLQVGDAELAGDRQRGDSAEPVMGMEEIPAAGGVRGEDLAQGRAEGTDRLLHRALGQRPRRSCIEVEQAHALGDLDDVRRGGVAAPGEEVDLVPEP